MADRQMLLEAFGKAEASIADLAAAGKLHDYRLRALEMLTSPTAAAAFDLSKEPATVVNRHGRTRFGQSCLLARRFVEAGVPFVQVNWSDHVEAEEDSGDGGWDHHYRNFQIMQDRHAPWLDQSFSALLSDLYTNAAYLHQRSCWRLASFSRDPKINDKAGPRPLAGVATRPCGPAEVCKAGESSVRRAMPGQASRLILRSPPPT